MQHSALALFVPFAPAGEPWVVRRARTVVETFTEQDQAVAAAYRLASALEQRMGASVSIEIQNADGFWSQLPSERERQAV